MKKTFSFFYLLIFLSGNTMAQYVGIGTNTPDAPLHISAPTLNEVLRLESNSPSISFFSDGQFRGYVWANGGTSMELGSVNNSNMPVTIAPNGVTKFKIFPDGHTGLGTINPQCYLHVNSDVDEALRLESTNTPYLSFYTSATQQGYISGDNGLKLGANVGVNKSLRLYAGLQEKITVLSNGNVGISNSNPLVNLHISSATSEAVRLQGPSPYMSFYDNNNYVGYVQATGNIMAIGTLGTNKISLYTGFSERLGVLANGNIGINQAAPTTTLDVNGYTRLGGEAEGAPKIKTKLITGYNTAASEGAFVDVHTGLVNNSKVISIQIFTSDQIPPNFTMNPGNEYQYFSSSMSDEILIFNIAGNSAAILNKPLTVFITYIE